MKNVKVTIVGAAEMYPAKRSLNIDDMVYLTREPDNKYDENAIFVINEDGEPLGYVSAQDRTTAEGATKAEEVVNLFTGEETLVAKVTSRTFVQVKNSDKKSSEEYTQMMAYVAEIIGEDKQDEKVVEEREFKFQLIGSEIMYPAKKTLREAVSAGERPYVSLNVSGDKIVANYKGELCGYVKNEPRKGMTPSSEIFSLIDEGSRAQIIEKEKLDFVGTFKLSNTKIEAIKVVATMEEVFEKIIEEGIDSKESLEEKLQYLKKSNVPDKAMLKIFTSYVSYPDHVRSRIPERPKTVYEDGSNIVFKSIAYMNSSRNLLFEGDRGVGKNVLTETLAWLYQRPLYEFSLNSQHDNSSLLGGKTFKEFKEGTEEEEISFSKSAIKLLKGAFSLKKEKETTDEEAREFSGVFNRAVAQLSGQQVIFEKSNILEACEYGGILVFDEFNTSLGHVLSVFNSLLDDRRRISVPGYLDIEAHPNFLAIATQNKNYQGTFENNEATIDRFVPIVFPQLYDIIDVLRSKVPTVSLDTLNSCQRLFEAVKASVEDGRVSETALTMRGFIDSCLAVEEGLLLKEALIDNIANRASDISDRKAITQMIDLQII